MLSGTFIVSKLNQIWSVLRGARNAVNCCSSSARLSTAAFFTSSCIRVASSLIWPRNSSPDFGANKRADDAPIKLPSKNPAKNLVAVSTDSPPFFVLVMFFRFAQFHLQGTMTNIILSQLAPVSIK
jgi:hypothetical protein